MKPIPEKYYPELWKETERLQFAMTAAGVGIWEVQIATNEVQWDDRCRELFGLAKENRIPYADAIQYIHKDDLQAVNDAVVRALSGEDNGRYDMRYRTIGADDGILRWVHFSGHAYFDENGKVTRFGGIAQDITEHTLKLQASEAALLHSEERFRSIISSAPAGIALFLGRELIIDTPNQVFIDILGKGPDITGKSLGEVLPELHNQPFLKILDDVYTSGKMFQSYGSPANIMKNNVLTTSYFNITFTPLFDNEGKVYAILDISFDVTEAVIARQQIEEGQKILADAVELANLATWTINFKTGKTEYSDRMKSWLGLSENGRDLETGIKSLPDHERERVKTAIQWAMDQKSGGVFDMEYGIINIVTGRERIIHSQARTFFDEEGKPVKLVGTALDITDQRNIRLALEQEVQLRTEELDSTNEELRATNEELHTTNDVLEELNNKLGESNENLQRFAHVASHDLKEPVRKIKTFLSMIESDGETKLSTKTKSLLERVYAATDRMFSMINGVLAYSSINATGRPTTKINLQEINDKIIQDLELIISEKNATINYKNLPVIEGAEILIHQLFTNLIINSLKFTRAGVDPVINISAVSNNDFVEITLADNGLGFNEKQSEQIFNMFARLHSKDKYEGTGLGLSLCKNIVERHGGEIRANGVPGEGSEFTITLPVMQTQNII